MNGSTILEELAMKTKASLKRLTGLVPAALLAAVIGAAPAWGVESLKKGDFLWRSENPQALMRLDADTATPGRELIVAGETDSFIDLGATVRSEIKVFARVVSADGSSEFGRLSKRVGISTNAYPDPGLTANQEGGGNETVYARNGRTTTIPNGFTTAEGVDRISDVFRFPVGFGFAKNDAGTTRTLVIGVGIEGNYSNFADGFVEVSRFAFFSFNGVPSAGKFTFLCARAFAGQSGDFELENRVAGVGNFLAGARVNDDEIRILEMNDAIGFARYRYFDPTDCSVLKTVFVKIKK